jgi:AhpD family alkylhydroperoxidase
MAVAVTARCDGCITVPHAEAAIRHGATKEEIAEALGVAVAVNAGGGARLLHARDGCGTLETAAQMANHASTRTTQIYDRRREELSLDEVERIRV